MCYPGSDTSQKGFFKQHWQRLKQVGLFSLASLVAQLIKNPPVMLETWVRSLGWEDTLEKEMATHSSILAERIPWTEEPGGLLSTGLHRVGHDRKDLAAAAAPEVEHNIIQNSRLERQETQVRLTQVQK